MEEKAIQEFKALSKEQQHQTIMDVFETQLKPLLDEAINNDMHSLFILSRQPEDSDNMQTGVYTNISPLALANFALANKNSPGNVVINAMKIIENQKKR